MFLQTNIIIVNIVSKKMFLRKTRIHRLKKIIIIVIIFILDKENGKNLFIMDTSSLGNPLMLPI